MLSGRLIHLIETHHRELTDRVLREIWRQQELPHVRRLPEAELRERGQAIVSATRMPNTPGVNGNGTIFGLVLKGVAPGSSTLSIVQVNARDSQQRPLQFVTKEASVKVQ